MRSVSLVQQSPYKMWKVREDGTLEPLLRLPGMTDCQSHPRQMLPPVYWQNGYVDVLRPRAVLERESMWGDTVLPFFVETMLFDLDYPEDIAPMEQALSRREAGRRTLASGTQAPPCMTRVSWSAIEERYGAGTCKSD